jgi:hypothetical protein
MRSSPVLNGVGNQNQVELNLYRFKENEVVQEEEGVAKPVGDGIGLAEVAERSEFDRSRTTI